MRSQTNIMHEKEDTVDGLMRQLAGYVESIAGDDESKILGAGMSVKSTTTAQAAPATPAGLSATEGDHEGEIDLSWDKLRGAKSYVIERSVAPPPLRGRMSRSRSSLPRPSAD